MFKNETSCTPVSLLAHQVPRASDQIKASRVKALLNIIWGAISKSRTLCEEKVTQLYLVCSVFHHGLRRHLNNKLWSIRTGLTAGQTDSGTAGCGERQVIGAIPGD